MASLKFNYNALIDNILKFLRWKMVYFFNRSPKLVESFVQPFGLFMNSLKHIKLMPIQWLNENRENLVRTLEQQETGYTYGPVYERGKQTVETVILPEINLYRFNNASVSALSSSVICDDKILIEQVPHVNPQKALYVQAHIVEHNDRYALVRKRKDGFIEKGVFLGGNGAFNYYHWMIEILPKLKYIDDMQKSGFIDYPLLVSEDVVKIQTFQESLNILAPRKNLIILKKNHIYNVGELLYINAPNNFPFNLRENEKMRIADFITRPSAVGYIRNALLPHQDLTRRVHESGKRIFMSRRIARRQYNEDEVFPIFRDHGFHPVFMDELSLKEQVALMANAEYVAGPTGAEWTNLLFCKEGTKCLCWMADKYSEFAAYSNLAKIIGAELVYLKYHTTAKSTWELYSRNYYINPNIIKQTLDAILKENF